jgi:hypothetical protein
MLLARAAVKRRAATAARHRTVSPMTVLRAAIRELATVRTETSRAGWTGELAGRAAAAVRLAGAVALSRPVSHKEVDRQASPSEGQVAAPAGVATLRGKATMLSAAVTPETLASNGHAGSVAAEGHSAELRRSLGQALAVFTAARYARPSAGSGRPESVEGRDGGLDQTALDSALAQSEDAVKRLRVRQVLRFGRRKPHAETAGVRPTWAR